MKKALIICATPYHILTAINFATVNVDSFSYDICLSLDFQNIESIAQNLRNTNFFENVLVLNEANLSYTKLKSFTRLISGNHYIEKLFKNRIYDEIYYCFTNPVLYTLIVQTIRKHNKNVRCFFIEDGIGSYTSYLERVSPQMQRFYRLIGKHPISEQPAGALFYMPSLVIKNYPCECQQLPSLANIRNAPVLLDKINKVLEYKSDTLYNRDVIYLNQPLFQDGVTEIAKMEIEALALLANKGLNPVIKCHPRTMDIDYPENYDKILGHIPFELFLLNNDLSNKMLITPFSTAAFTPKLLFNQEPMLIFLYKILRLDKLIDQIEDVEKFILSVKKTYTDENRVQIPETFEELAFVLDLLNSLRTND